MSGADPDDLERRYVRLTVARVRMWQEMWRWSESRAIAHAVDQLLRAVPLDLLLHILDRTGVAEGLPHRQRRGLARRTLLDLLTRAVRVVS